jgi:hypothetical protein
VVYLAGTGNSLGILSFVFPYFFSFLYVTHTMMGYCKKIFNINRDDKKTPISDLIDEDIAKYSTVDALW